MANPAQPNFEARLRRLRELRGHGGAPAASAKEAGAAPKGVQPAAPRDRAAAGMPASGAAAAGGDRGRQIASRYLQALRASGRSVAGVPYSEEGIARFMGMLKEAATKSNRPFFENLYQICTRPADAGERMVGDANLASLAYAVELLERIQSQGFDGLRGGAAQPAESPAARGGAGRPLGGGVAGPLRRSYGPSEIEQLDIFRTDAPAPIFVFIHGGAWRTGLAKDYAGPAAMFGAAGAHYIVPDFVWVQDAAGNLFTMAEQVCRAIAWVYRNAESFGGDPDRLYLGGHSSGAHLATVALTIDWHREFGLPADLIKACLCSSGIYDLAPIAPTHSSYIHFTDEMIEALSPQRHIERLRVPLVVSYGTYEKPMFRQQALGFTTALKAAGKPFELIVGQGLGHLDMPETLRQPDGLLGAAVLRQMGLGAA